MGSVFGNFDEIASHHVPFAVVGMAQIDLGIFRLPFFIIIPDYSITVGIAVRDGEHRDAEVTGNAAAAIKTYIKL